MKKFNIKSQFMAALMVAGITSSSLSGLHTTIAAEAKTSSEKSSKLDSLVSSDVITKEQKITIESAIKSILKKDNYKRDIQNKTIKEALGNLVISGFLSDDQKDAIEDVYLNNKTNQGKNTEVS